MDWDLGDDPKRDGGNSTTGSHECGCGGNQHVLRAERNHVSTGNGAAIACNTTSTAGNATDSSGVSNDTIDSENLADRIVSMEEGYGDVIEAKATPIKRVPPFVGDGGSSI